MGWIHKGALYVAHRRCLANVRCRSLSVWRSNYLRPLSSPPAHSHTVLTSPSSPYRPREPRGRHPTLVYTIAGAAGLKRGQQQTGTAGHRLPSSTAHPPFPSPPPWQLPPCCAPRFLTRAPQPNHVRNSKPLFTPHHQRQWVGGGGVHLPSPLLLVQYVPS